MKRVLWYVVIAVGMTATWLPAVAFAQQPAAAEATGRALADLDRWLGDNENAQRWRSYLLTEELQGQLSDPQNADNAVVGEALKRFHSGKSGLSGARFQSVARALSAWHVELMQNQPLSELAKGAVADFEPIDNRQVELVKSRMLIALADLRRFLRSGPQQNADAWEEYLQWPRLIEQIEVDVPNPTVVESILDNWETNKPGLEGPRFLLARQLLRDYAYFAAAAGDESFEETYAKRLDELAARLDAYDAEGSTDDAIAIGRTLGWLESTGKAQELVMAVRARYWNPNFFAYASKRLTSVGFEQPVNRVTPVNDVILGTQLHGTAHLTGGTTLQLIPNPNQAQFNLLLAGTAFSNTVGYNRGVTICSTGVTHLQASKPLWMSEAGLRSSLTRASGQTSTTINSISAKRRFVERIASDRAAEQKPQAEAIASQRAAGRLQQSFEAESSPMVADANRRFVERFKNPLLRRNAYPEDVDFSTTPFYVTAKSLTANKSQIGAPEPPAKLELPYDLCTQVHESGVINFGEAALGGVLLTDERLVELLRDELKAEVPEELEITEDKDPWSITFANEVPLRAKFQDGAVSIAIRGDRFTRADQVINEPIEISALYKIEITDAGTARLARDGDVEVTFLGRERLSAAQVAFRTFLRRKFRAMFKDEFVGEGLKLKGRWAAAGTLRLELIDSNANWLNLGWNMPGPAVAPRMAAKP